MASRDAQVQVLEATLRRPPNGDRLRYCIGATAMTLKRRQGRGLPVADAPDEGGQHWLREAIETATWLCGDFPLIRNDLSLTKALSAYNQPFHSEHHLTGLKGAGLLAPRYRR